MLAGYRTLVRLRPVLPSIRRSFNGRLFRLICCLRNALESLACRSPIFAPNLTCKTVRQPTSHIKYALLSTYLPSKLKPTVSSVIQLAGSVNLKHTTGSKRPLQRRMPSRSQQKALRIYINWVKKDVFYSNLILDNFLVSTRSDIKGRS